MIHFSSHEIYDFADFISDKTKRACILHVIPEADTIITPEGTPAFGAYNPEDETIYVAGGHSPEVKENVLHVIAHEYHHHLERCANTKHSEKAAEIYTTRAVAEWEERRHYE